METSSQYTVLNRDDLPRDSGTFEFEGFLYSATEVSFIWVDMPPGGMVRLHRHPYKEIFIVLEGVPTFVIGQETLTGLPGQIIMVPAGIPHMFTNAGPTQLKQIDIHVNRQFITEWLEE